MPDSVTAEQCALRAHQARGRRAVLLERASLYSAAADPAWRAFAVARAARCENRSGGLRAAE